MVAAKGPLTPPTAIPLRLATVDHDVPPTDDPALRTVRVVAELLLRVHACLPVMGCRSCITCDAPWTRLLLIPPRPDPRPTVGWVATHPLPPPSSAPIFLDTAARTAGR